MSNSEYFLLWRDVVIAPPERSTGKNLSKLGTLHGLRRRFFGLEPDFLYRERISAHMKKIYRD